MAPNEKLESQVHRGREVSWAAAEKSLQAYERYVEGTDTTDGGRRGYDGAGGVRSAGAGDPPPRPPGR